MLTNSVTLGAGQNTKTKQTEKRWKQEFGRLPKLISCTVGRRKSKAMYFVNNSLDVARLMKDFVGILAQENGQAPQTGTAIHVASTSQVQLQSHLERGLSL